MRIRGTRILQVGILVLLLVSAVQVFWWIIDQSRRTSSLRHRLTELYTEDARAAAELQRRGADRAMLEALFPHLTVNSRGKMVIRAEALESLRQDRVRWLNQYGWEGGFFLAVLVVSMVAVWRALYQESILRRRQQNFVAAVSHELKSPLSSLQLAVETLSLRELPRDRVLELTERMSADVRRMKDMITNILDTSQLEQRRIMMHPDRIALASMVSQVLEELEYRRIQAGASVVVAVSDLEIWADPVGVRAVLRNLLDNALKAVMGEEAGTVRIEARREGKFVHLRVEDNGVGFLPEEAKRLFDKFYRPGDEIRRKGSGQGLGLHIARRFIELEDGRLQAASAGVGRGAVFEAWWPQAEEETS